MGVLYDYFRAADDLAVADLMQATRGQSPVTNQVADGVDAKGIEYTVTLGQLVALILDVAWTPDLVAGKLIWPADVLVGGSIVYQTWNTASIDESTATWPGVAVADGDPAGHHRFLGRVRRFSESGRTAHPPVRRLRTGHLGVVAVRR
jgi:hypothetical protein